MLMISVATLGCVSLQYPDQRALFMASPEGRHYTLFETSGHELELYEQRSIERAVIALGVVRQHFVSNTNIVQFIDAQIAHMRRYEEGIMKAQRMFTNTIGERDRVFRFVYTRDDECETGFLIIREGRIILRSVE
jgi:hypothetical protein